VSLWTTGVWLIVQAPCPVILIRGRATQLLERKSFIPEFVVLSRTVQSDRTSIRLFKNLCSGFTRMNIQDLISRTVISEEIVLGGWPECHIIFIWNRPPHSNPWVIFGRHHYGAGSFNLSNCLGTFPRHSVPLISYKVFLPWKSWITVCWTVKKYVHVEVTHK
jgi:hypothetical protein